MIRCYKKGDFEKLNLQPEQELERNETWKAFACEKSLVFADGDRVLAIIRPQEENGRLAIYALVGRDCGYKSVSMVKTIKTWIKNQIKRPDIERVEITTQSQFDQANRLAEMLGFVYEGTLHKFYNGIDFNIWGIWK